MLQQSLLLGYYVHTISIKDLEKTGHFLASSESICHDVGNARILQFPTNFLVLAADLENMDKQGYIYENNFKFGEFSLSRSRDTFDSKLINIISFDTVRFAVPMSPLDFISVTESFLPYQQFVRYKVNQDIESSNLKFMLVTPDEMDTLSSDTKTVNFYYSDSRHIIFEMSIPKQLYGHNSLMFWQLDTFFERFRNYLIHNTGLNIEHWENWLLKRVDICYNYHLDSLQEVENTLNYLSDLRMRNRASIRNSTGKNIAYWAFQTRTIKFYSKYHEMLIHKKSFDPDTYDIILQNSKNILRFEEEWRTKYLLSKLNLKKVEQVTIGKFINYVLKHYNRNDHIESLLGECTMIDKKFSIIDILDSVDKLKKSSMYRLFVLSIVDLGLDAVKASMSKSSYYQKAKVLRSVGIDLSIINERFHQGLDNLHDKIKTDFTKAPLSNLFDEEAIYKQKNIQPETIPLSLKDFLLDKEVRFTNIDGLNASLPPEYQIKLFAG